jgi:hypothetical protein
MPHSLQVWGIPPGRVGVPKIAFAQPGASPRGGPEVAPKVFANFPPGPTPFLGERGNRHLAHSVAGPWQWGRGG